MKWTTFTLCALLIAGCATRNVKHNTEGYKDCVFSQAMTLDDGQDTPENIANLAAAQCQKNLELITEKLREENAWLEKGSNSDKITESLRDKTIQEVILEIGKRRQAK
jgi:hypothetical protein